MLYICALARPCIRGMHGVELDRRSADALWEQGSQTLSLDLAMTANKVSAGRHAALALLGYARRCMFAMHRIACIRVHEHVCVCVCPHAS